MNDYRYSPRGSWGIVGGWMGGGPSPVPNGALTQANGRGNSSNRSWTVWKRACLRVSSGDGERSRHGAAARVGQGGREGGRGKAIG